VPADVTDVAAGIQPSTLVRKELGCMILAFSPASVEKS
jgi:hypothetical protein